MTNQLTDLLDTIQALYEKATPGDWQVQTGCSWRRIGAGRGDGNVICPTTSISDGHPDLTTGKGEDLAANLELICQLKNAWPTLRTALSRHAGDGVRNAFDDAFDKAESAWADSDEETMFFQDFLWEHLSPILQLGHVPGELEEQDRDNAFDSAKRVAWRSALSAKDHRLNMGGTANEALRAAVQAFSEVFCDTVGELLSHPRESEGWRPIETAPKDERVILFSPCWGTEAGYHSITRTREPSWFSASGAPYADTEQPTHWMPLPSPPMVEARDD